MPDNVGEHRILIVEDEPVVAETISLILSSAGYQPFVAHSAEAALESLGDWVPHLAILDVMLPKMNGIDLAMALKEHFPDCRILLISGQPSVDGLLQASREQGHDFEILAKPVYPTEMLEAIASLLSSNGCEHCHQG